MRRPRSNHTAAFKAKVAVAALQGDKTLAERAEQFDLPTNHITQWRAPLLEGATEVFLTAVEKRDTGPDTKDKQAKIGQSCWRSRVRIGTTPDRRHRAGADAPY